MNRNDSTLPRPPLHVDSATLISYRQRRHSLLTRVDKVQGPQRSKGPPSARCKHLCHELSSTEILRDIFSWHWFRFCSSRCTLSGVNFEAKLRHQKLSWIYWNSLSVPKSCHQSQHWLLPVYCLLQSLSQWPVPSVHSLSWSFVPIPMTLNDLERCNNPYFGFFTEFDSFAGRLCHSGWRETYNISKILSPSSSLHFRPKLMYPAARFLCDSWASCFLPCRYLKDLTSLEDRQVKNGLIL